MAREFSAPLGAECGCGAPALYRLKVTPRLDMEFFLFRPESRPQTVDVCSLCVVDMQAYAAPLEEVWS